MPSMTGQGAATTGAPEEIDPVATAAYFASEAAVPGGSNFIKGDLRTGLLYAVLGGIARNALGTAGAVIIGASSFTKATRGRHLHDYVGVARRPSTADLEDRLARLEAAMAAGRSGADPSENPPG